jgi:hypothetical protein
LVALIGDLGLSGNWLKDGAPAVVVIAEPLPVALLNSGEGGASLLESFGDVMCLRIPRVVTIKWIISLSSSSSGPSVLFASGALALVQAC